jgi:hypothetical protein
MALMTGVIYEVRSLDGFMCHNINAKIHEYWYKRSSKIKILPQQFEML